MSYDLAGTFEPFTNVIGVNSAEKSGIAETENSYASNYYEFDEVTTTRIKLEVLKTQTANDQKYLNQIVATKEIGTLLGFPRVAPSMTRNETKGKTLSHKYIVQKATKQIK